MRRNLIEPFRRIRLQHPFVLEHRETRCGDADDQVRLRVRFFREELRGDDAGGIAHPFDVDVRIRFLERLFVGLDLIGFERRVNKQLGFLRRRRQREGRKGDPRDD